MIPIPEEVRKEHMAVCAKCPERKWVAKKVDFHVDWLDCFWDCPNDYDHWEAQQTERERVMTNADCIRHMSDEQLYEFLSEWECGDIDYSVTFCDLCNEATKRGEIGNVLNLDCDGCRKHWLQRDAVEYGGLMYWKKNTTFDATADRKDEPQTDCDGCQHYADEYTADACYECSRSYADCYEPQTERSRR